MYPWLRCDGGVGLVLVIPPSDNDGGKKCSAVFRVSESVTVTVSKQERERVFVCVCVLLSCVQYRFHIELFPFAGCKNGANPFGPLLQGCLDASECLMSVYTSPLLRQRHQIFRSGSVDQNYAFFISSK